jgi:RNA polymerase sigma-70 factor, ECF subfamily
MQETGRRPQVTTIENETAFGALLERHRRELQVHCYRMLGSFEDSQDAVQETFLRAWRKRDTFEGRSSHRAWLYRIATNTCLDALDRRPRRLAARQAEVPWLQPFPDALLEEIPASEDEPDVAVVAKETIELAFLAAIQHVPPRPRAVLILRDVLGWSAKETAALLDTTVASANSALQRARATLRRELPERRLEWRPGEDPGEAERALVARYIDATERGDAHAVAAMMREDARFSMPPEPGLWIGRDTIVAAWLEGGFGTEENGELRCVATRSNMQPAVACYAREPDSQEARPLAIDVLRVENGEIAEILTFGPHVFPAFGLPPAL